MSDLDTNDLPDAPPAAAPADAGIEAHWAEHAVPAGYPDWFDEKKHHAGQGGIIETKTGVLLDDDGHPASPALRAKRKHDAHEAKLARDAAKQGK